MSLVSASVLARFSEHLGLFAACLMAGTMTFSRALFNLGALLLVIAWLISITATKGRTSPRMQLAGMLAIALFSWIGVSALYSPSPSSEAWRQVMSYSDLLFIPLIMTFIRDARAYKFFVTATALSLVILLSTLLGYLAYYSRTHNPGMFTNHIVEGFSLGVLCLGLLFFGLKHWPQSRLLAVVSLSGCGLAAYTVFFLNPGRGAHLALGFGLMIYFLCAVPRRKRAIAFGGFILAALLVASQSQIIQSRFQTAISEFQNHEVQKSTSVGLRLNAWKAGLELWSQSPLVGHGSKSYQLLMHEEQSEAVGGCKNGSNPVCLQPHNQFILLAVEQGAIGLTLFIALLFAIAWPNFSVKRVQLPPPLPASLITCFAVHAFFDSGLRMGYQSFTFIIVTVALLAHQMLIANTPLTPDK